MNRRSRKRKYISSNTSSVNLFRNQQWQNEISHRDPSEPAPSLPARISTSMTGRKPNRLSISDTHTSTNAPSCSTNIFHADNSQPASSNFEIPVVPKLTSAELLVFMKNCGPVFMDLSGTIAGSSSSATQPSTSGCDSKRKKGFKKSITKFPSLFTRLLRLDSKFYEVTGISENNCPSKNKSTDSNTAKKGSLWTTFIMRLTGNQIPSTSHWSQPPSSFVSFSDPSFYSNLGPSTSQVDRASTKHGKLPSDMSTKNVNASSFDRKEVTGSVRKASKSDQNIQASQLSRALPKAHSSSTLPKVIGNMDDDFALVLYPKLELSSASVRLKNSNRKEIQRRHSERTLDLSNIQPSSDRSVGRIKLQQATRAAIKSSQTAPSSCLSDLLGDVPFISVPVLEPVRVKHPSWRKMQRKVFNKTSERRFSEPSKISFSGQNKERIVKFPAESSSETSNKSSWPTLITSFSSESYPFGDVPPISYPVLEPVRAEVSAPSTSLVRNFCEKDGQKNNFESSTTNFQWAHSNETSSFNGEKMYKHDKSVAELSQAAVRSSHQTQSASHTFGKEPPTFSPVLEPIKVAASLTTGQNCIEDGSQDEDFRDSSSEPQSQDSIHSNDQNINEPRSYFKSTEAIKSADPLQTSSRHTPILPVLTQILEPIHDGEISTPVSPPMRRLQQVSEQKSTTSDSSSSSTSEHDTDKDVKSCPESAQVTAESSHPAPVTHSGLADPSVTIPPISLPVLDPVYDGQVSTSTNASSRSLHEEEMLEKETSSTNTMASDLSSPSPSNWRSSTLSPGKENTSSTNSEIMKSRVILKHGFSCEIIEHFSGKEASEFQSARGKLSPRSGAVNSSCSSLPAVIQSSTETIDKNCFSYQKRATISLTNFLPADSTTSESAGSDIGNSTDFRKTNTKGHTEGSFASSSLTADEQCSSGSHNNPVEANISGEKLSFVRQQTIKKKAKKTKGERPFFRKLMSAFTAPEKNEYKKLPKSKAKPRFSVRRK